MGFPCRGITTIKICLALIIVETYGELIILRHPTTDNGTRRKLTCVSDDDDGALIWNYNFDNPDPHRGKNNFTNFEPEKPPSNKVAECALWQSKRCTKWETTGRWEATNSTNEPMGPVLDYRWENFTEYYLTERFQRLGVEQRSSGSIVFSVRGFSDFYILLCEERVPTGGPCFAIIIGGSRGTRSAIRTCGSGVPDSVQSVEGEGCVDLVSATHEADGVIHGYEWRTFTIKWSDNEKQIQLFKGTDRENKPFLEATVDQWRNQSNLIIMSQTAARVRFHFYDYFRTEQNDSVISTAEFYHREEYLCIKMLVGLCPECKLDVSPIDREGRRVVTWSVSDDGKSLRNKLLHWQSVKRSIRLHPQHLKLEIRTIRNRVEGKGRWAIDTFHTCNSLGEYRKSTITTIRETTGAPFWHEARCQKLSYKESAVVDSRSRTKTYRDTKEFETFIEGWRKSCGSSCGNLREYWSFCDPDGCTCDQGINCHEKCSPGHYDYDCKNRCGKCDGNICNTITGYCGTRCIRNNLVPPLCHTEFEKPNITSVTDTTARVFQRVELEKNVPNLLFLYIPNESGGYVNITEFPTKSGTHSPYEVMITDLQPGRRYKVYAVLEVQMPGETTRVTVRSPDTEFWTNEKVVTPQLAPDVRELRASSVSATTVRLEWKAVPQNIVNVNYNVSIKLDKILGCVDLGKVSPQQEEIVTAANETKVFINGLHPYTNYTATVTAIATKSGVSATRSTTVFQTDQKAPPAVTDLEIFAAVPDENSIFLRWTAPYPPNCGIEFYKVSILQGKKEVHNKTIKESGSRPTYELALPPNLLANNTRIEVSAINKNVKVSGAPSTVQFDPFQHFKVPSRPLNLEAHPLAHGIINLTWSHPSISYYRIKQFSFEVKLLKTTLKSYKNRTMKLNYDVSQERNTYFTELHLLTSTSYQISMKAVNINNYRSSPAQVNISVPDGCAFVSGQDLQIKKTDNMIGLKIPGVENATKNSMVSVNVTGFMRCGQKQSQTSSLTSEPTKWVITPYKPEGKKSKLLKIDPNEGLRPNCSLQLEEFYIKVVLKDGYFKNLANLTSPALSLIENDQNYLPWLIIFPVIAICVILVFVSCRQSKGIPRQPRTPSYLEIIPLDSPSTSQNNLPIVETTSNSVFLRGATEIRRSVPLYAIPDEPDSRAVSLKYFEEYAKKAAASGLLNSQFMLLPRGLTKPCNYGSLPENMPKNRYKNLVAYDHTRVVLEKISDDPYSDYINASYIKGYLKERAYIAAQGPKPNTVNYFWRMIWQEDVRVICMLANVVEGFRTMCEKYWPDVGTRVKYGEFLISNTRNQVFAHYTFRTFKLSYRRDTREVTHLHYTGWPILGVPSSQSLVEYMKKLFQTPAGNGPVVVHCDTGDGRTDTVILCDICLRQAIAERIIDVTAVITRMRDSRANMVATPQQYLLAHIIISESIVSIPTQIPCTENLSKRIERMRLQLPTDLQRLDDTTWHEEALELFATLEPLDELVPEGVAVSNSDVSRTLERKSNQISAVSVDGVKTKNQYLASWLPPPLSLNNFWKFVAAENIKLIIILQCSDLKNPTCCDIFPDERILLSMPDIRIEIETSHNDGEYFTTEKLLLTDISEKNVRTQSVTVLTCKGWEQGKDRKPPTPAALVSLWRASEKIPRKVGQTIVLCHDGITGCGLYLALSYVLERMAVDRECDVISAIRTVRRSNPEFVQSKKQCEYLYDAAETYAEYFQCYANFT